MNNLYLLASVGFFLWAIRNTLFWTNLWQTKEYRLDRLWVHIRETSKGKDILVSFSSFVKWLLVFAYPIPATYPHLFFIYYALISFVLTLDFIFVIKEIFKRRLRRPIFTARALLVLLFSFLFLIVLYIIPLLDRFLWLLIVNRSIPLVVAFFVLVSYIPSEIVKDFLVSRAARKLNSLSRVNLSKIKTFKKSKRNGLLVIGVSGSYGKSSTKEYTAQILGEKFNVVRTFGSHNTPIGISRTVLSKVKEDTEIFVVELGSYKRGEVAELCQIVYPQISITTSISDQHLSLYGSFQNILSTENELIASLPKEGIALFNANSQFSLELSKKTRKKKLLYGTKAGLDIAGQNIKVKKTSIEFEAVFFDEKISLTAPLLGSHNVENILPGVFLGRYLGMSLKDLQKAVSKLRPLPKTMNTFNSSHGFTIIDDTFNASPESVLSALSYAKIYPRKKFLVLEPMIELGTNAEIDHYKLAKEISKVFNYVFVTNKNSFQSLQKGIQDSLGKCKIHFWGTQEIADFITNRARKGDIVVLEGRESSMVLDKIL